MIHFSLTFAAGLINNLLEVHRALLYWVSGTFKSPRSKAGAFSKMNWGDYVVQSARVGGTIVKCSSVFLKRIKSLKDQQWEDIFDAAIEFDETGKQADLTAEPKDTSGGESDESELLDPLYDM